MPAFHEDPTQRASWSAVIDANNVAAPINHQFRCLIWSFWCVLRYLFRYCKRQVNLELIPWQIVAHAEVAGQAESKVTVRTLREAFREKYLSKHSYRFARISGYQCCQDTGCTYNDVKVPFWAKHSQLWHASLTF